MSFVNSEFIKFDSGRFYTFHHWSDFLNLEYKLFCNSIPAVSFVNKKDGVVSMLKKTLSYFSQVTEAFDKN